MCCAASCLRREASASRSNDEGSSNRVSTKGSDAFALLLPGAGFAITVRIGAGFNHAPGCDADQHGGRATRPARARADVMMAFSQLGHHRGVDALVEKQIPGIHGVIIETGK